MIEDVQRCSHCILPVDLPSIRVDDQGVCNQCRSYEDLTRKWNQQKIDKKTEFENQMRRVKKLNRPYDCLIPLSGGKDSSYALYLCDKVYKLKCLCVTFDNGFLSDHARGNIRRAIENTHADHIYYTINRNVMLELYRLFIKKCGTFCPACMSGIEMIDQIADKFKIPLVVSGNGWKVSYLSDLSELFQGGSLDYFKNVIKGEEIEKLVRPMLVNPRSWTLKRLVRIVFNILRIPNPMIKHYIALYDYIDPVYDEIYKTIRKELDWVSPEKKSEHMDCKIHDIAHYIHTRKFPELTYNTAYRSGLIRMGLLSREEALRLENIEKEESQIPAELGTFLNEIGMWKDEFEEAISDWRKINDFRKGTISAVKSIYHKIIGQ